MCFSLLLVCVEDNDVVCGFCHLELWLLLLFSSASVHASQTKYFWQSGQGTKCFYVSCCTIFPDTLLRVIQYNWMRSNFVNSLGNGRSKNFGARLRVALFNWSWRQVAGIYCLSREDLWPITHFFSYGFALCHVTFLVGIFSVNSAYSSWKCFMTLVE